MTDFRALCTELADAYLRLLEHVNNSTWLGYEPSDDPLVQRARSALAEPTPMPDDFRVKKMLGCAANMTTEPLLFGAYENGKPVGVYSYDEKGQLLFNVWKNGALVAIYSCNEKGQPGRRVQPTGDPPSTVQDDPAKTELNQIEPDVESVLTLAAIIREVDGSNLKGAAALAESILSHSRAASVLQPAALTPPAEGEVGGFADFAAWLAREMPAGTVIGDPLWWAPRIARRAAAQLRFVQPVPVSERPWERDGWCDAEGRCWLRGKVEGDWRLLNPGNSGVPQLKYCFSDCLPAHALPLPSGEVE